MIHHHKSARLDIFSKIGNITASFPLLLTSSHQGRREKVRPPPTRGEGRKGRPPHMKG